MYRGGLSAPISSAGGMAKLATPTSAAFACATKSWVPAVLGLAFATDRTTAGGHPLRQHSCRHPEPAPWRCRGQLMPIWAIAISVAGVQAIREGTVIPQVSPAIAGRAASNATKPTPTSWRTFFIRLRKTIHGAALSSARQLESRSTLAQNPSQHGQLLAGSALRPWQSRSNSLAPPGSRPAHPVPARRQSDRPPQASLREQLP